MVDEFRAWLHADQHRIPEEAVRGRARGKTDKGGLMLNPGDKAPDFTGRDHNGNTVKLSDFKGKTVVLWFYPKADTPG
jgi:cytochrome oxidase Cu insertion factor (SCO1/SenC/PrrC family)